MSITRILKIFGIDPKKMIAGWFVLPGFLFQYLRFKRTPTSISKKIPFGKLRPELYDRFKSGGTAKGHYFHQDLYVAQKIFQNNPAKHVDIGSRVDGFVAHVASFREIEVFDIRETTSVAKNIVFKQADITNLKQTHSNYADSVSCLHALEHIGLGRYGDELDQEGHVKGLESLHSMLKENGILYLSSPIGPLRVEFNSQRVFSIRYLLSLFEHQFNVEEFAYVDDSGDLVTDAKLLPDNIESNFNCLYGCGIWTLKKI